MAAWRASGGSEFGFAAFAAWSSKSGKDIPNETRVRWGSIFFSSPPTQISAASLFFLANEARPDWVKPADYAHRPNRRSDPADLATELNSADEWPDTEPLFEPSEAERPYPY